jgi:hypothetical protein
MKPEVMMPAQASTERWNSRKTSAEVMVTADTSESLRQSLSHGHQRAGRHLLAFFGGEGAQPQLDHGRYGDDGQRDT